MYAALGASGFFASLYLQSAGIGYTAFEAGIVQLPTTILLLVFAPTFGRLADRDGPRRYLVAGPLLFAVGSLLLATVDSRTVDLVGSAPWVTFDGFDALVPGLLLWGLGLAMLVSPITSTALRAAPDAQAGIASAVSNLAARVGTLLAIALLGLLVAWVFDQSVIDDLDRSAWAGVEPFSSTSDVRSGGDLDAWRVAMVGCAVLAVAGALVSWVGLRGMAVGPIEPETR